jgi:peptide chain release factor 1
MLQKLTAVEKRFEELERLLCDPQVIARQADFQKFAKERSEIEPVVEAFRRFTKVEREIAENETLLKDSDPEMREMARTEIVRLKQEKDALQEELKILLLPTDPNDEKNILLEVRGGTGGEEAALFAHDLFRMYSRYAERQRWKVELMSISEAAAGGIKEAIALIEGKGAYSRLKYESGVHRVQRVPATEAQGRIHTSTATVAVLPEAEDVDIKIDDKELRVDVMRASGPGGQGVNTTDSAVRITHLPTNMVVYCQDERSQIKNRAKAMKILRSRLLEQETARQQAERSDMRRGQVGSGERSEKIRTYNFPQDRMTDHRIGLTRHNLPSLLDGELTDVIEALRTYFQAEALKSQSEGQAPSSALSAAAAVDDD